MTQHKSFKRLVRARMEKTAESYTTARARLLAAEEPKATEGPALPMSDATIRERTGRGWEEWFDLLDAWGAADRTQKEASRWVSEEHGVDGWGAQAVTISYHRARGLRAVGEGPQGFTVTASKTVTVPVDRLFAAFTDERERRRWLPGAPLRERTVLKPKSARYDWEDGDTRVNVFFESKGEGKSLVVVQHERLDAEGAERMKAYWRERVATAKEVLEA